MLDLNDPKLVQAIWKPEVYFPNAKEAEFQYVTVPNLLLSIKPMGRILYMLRCADNGWSSLSFHRKCDLCDITFTLDWAQT